MQDEPGTHELTVEIQRGEQISRRSVNVLVVKEKFAIEHLKLPKDKVDLDERPRRDGRRNKSNRENLGRGIGDALVASRIYRTGPW